MKSTKEWYERTIDKVKRIVISPSLLEETISISEASRINPGSETLGYFLGLTQGDEFHAVRLERVSYGTWHKLRLKNGNGYQKSFFEEADRQNLQLQTLTFHSHPGENLIHRLCWPNHWKYKDDLHFELVKKELEKGIHGKKSVVEIINEDMRNLSQADVDNLPGDIQIIISPTYVKDKELSHIQAYSLGRDNDFPEIREVSGTIPLSFSNSNSISKAEKFVDAIEQANHSRYQSWHEKTIPEIDKTIPYKIWTRLPFYLTINELNSLTTKEAVDLYNSREKLEWKLDALVLT